jgi:hypothetical protein
MKTKEEYTSWETIKKQYPDRFVLIKDPVFEQEQIFKGGTFIYKHKSRKKVFEKDFSLQLPYATILYTGGIRGDRVNETTLIL